MQKKDVAKINLQAFLWTYFRNKNSKIFATRIQKFLHIYFCMCFLVYIFLYIQLK